MITMMRGVSAAVLTGVLLAPVPALADAAGPAKVSKPVAEAIKALPTAQEERTGYKRSSFKHWIDEDSDGCSTRAEVLLQEAVDKPQVGPNCRLSGGKWRSYYDGVEVTEAGKLDIDHVVPLAEAWDSGASHWSAEQRKQFANDLGSERSLVAVTARSNRQKADKDPAQWWAPDASASCQYLSDWVATKTRWNLTVDETERNALTAKAANCAGTRVETELAQ